MNVLFFLSFFPLVALACTAIIVGRDGTYDGSVFNAHSDDTKIHDFRLAKVSSQVHIPGARRGVFPDHSYYPRYVGYEKGELFLPENVEQGFYDWQPSTPIGFIPEVEETYGYIDAPYAIMNEKQLAIGESTCGARFAANPVYDNGSALFCINELTRIALERCTTARDAILTMGKLAEQYGFYGSEYDDPDPTSCSGEALTVTDTKEGWVFHILPDDTGKSAIWAAQRVPDNHLAVVANHFTIRTMNITDDKNFLASKNVYSVAIRAGLYQPKTTDYSDFNFAQTYTVYAIPGVEVTKPRLIWAARRPWRIQSLASPSTALPPDCILSDLPFSVPVDKKLHPSDLFRIYRDHYEGTPYDLTQGFGAGPFGDPSRFAGVQPPVSRNLMQRGGFERPVSVISCYTFISQSRAWLPDAIGGRLWFGPHSAHSTVYSPIYPSMMTLPKGLQTGCLYRFTFESTWWTFLVVTNYMQRAWKYIHPDVEAVRQRLESNNFVQIEEVERQAQSIFEQQGEAAVRTYLADYSETNHKHILGNWTDLFHFIVTKFHDGAVVDDFQAQDITFHVTPWPLWWLEQGGFFKPSAHDKVPFSIPSEFDVPPLTVLPYPGSLSTLLQNPHAHIGLSTLYYTNSTNNENTSNTNDHAHHHDNNHNHNHNHRPHHSISRASFFAAPSSNPNEKKIKQGRTTTTTKEAAINAGDGLVLEQLNETAGDHGFFFVSWVGLSLYVMGLFGVGICCGIKWNEWKMRKQYEEL